MRTLLLLAAIAAAPVQSQSRAPFLVSAEWLKTHLGEADLVVLEIGMPRARYDDGHIPGARYARMDVFHNHEVADRLPDPDAMSAELGRLGISNRSHVVIAGDPMGASILFVALDYLGHGARTSVLDGGVAAWRDAGGSLSQERVAVTPATFTPSVRTDMVVDAAWVGARLQRPGVALLDARTQAEYDGTARESLPRRGHLPGARLLAWNATLDRQAGGGGMTEDNSVPGARLLPPDQLQALFAASGAAPGNQVVTYCTVGMRASHLYFVARLLGHDARLYVGSMADWTRDPSRPVIGAGSRP